MKFMLLQNYGGVENKDIGPMSTWTPAEIEAHIAGFRCVRPRRQAASPVERGACAAAPRALATFPSSTTCNVWQPACGRLRKKFHEGVDLAPACSSLG